jgi:hypothetical protein
MNMPKNIKKLCIWLLVGSCLALSACAKQKAPDCKEQNCLGTQAAGVWNTSKWDQDTWQ